MHWPNRHLVVPIVVCSTITGVCFTLYYYLKKKEDEDNPRKTRIETRRPACIELEIPKKYISAIVGRAGSVIQDLQSRTSTKILFESDTNGESLERTCYIKGKLENVQMAAALVKKIIETEATIETKEMYAPHKACRRIIGPSGESIREIQALTGTRINVESYAHGSQPMHPDSKRKIMIRGNTEQIESAMALIEEKIAEEEIKKDPEIIDLTQPELKKEEEKELNTSLEVIEEIELSTPTKNFIADEQHVETQQRMSNLRIDHRSNIAPAGYESDLSDNSDDLEMF